MNHRPLFIAAAAIHSVLHPEANVVALSGREVVEALARRELARLRDEGAAAGLSAEALPRLAAIAAVRGPLDGAALAALASRPDLHLGLSPAGEIVDKVRQGGRLVDGTLPPPEPDILAAALVVEVCSTNPAQVPEWLWAAIEGDIAGGLARVARLSHDAETMLGILDPGRRISRWLAKAVEGNRERCEAVQPMIAKGLEQGLIPAAIAALRCLIKNADSKEDKASFLVPLSGHLFEVGDVAEALQAIREALEIYRRARFKPGLAASLHNLSNYLLKVDEVAEALQAIRKAVVVYCRLAKDNPARFEADLASSLNNLSNCLTKADCRTGALAAIRRAIEIRRRLAEDNPTRFEADLALSLNNLSNRLADAGDGAGALRAIQEAVVIRRRLALANPARFEADLARSLGVLGICLRRDGRVAEARDAFEEGIRLVVEPYAEKIPVGRPGGSSLGCAVSSRVSPAALNSAGQGPDKTPCQTSKQPVCCHFVL